MIVQEFRPPLLITEKARWLKMSVCVCLSIYKKQSCANQSPF